MGWTLVHPISTRPILVFVVLFAFTYLILGTLYSLSGIRVGLEVLRNSLTTAARLIFQYLEKPDQTVRIVTSFVGVAYAALIRIILIATAVAKHNQICAKP